MAKFSYTVTIEVDDEDLILGGDFDETEKIYSPKERAEIIISEALASADSGLDKIYVGDYSLAYQENNTEVDYDSLHEKVVDYLISGKAHSTLVGVIINLDGDKGKKDVIEAIRLADFFIDLLKEIN